MVQVATMRQNSEISAELNSAKAKISELEHYNTRLLEANGTFFGSPIAMPYLNHSVYPYETFYFLRLH